MCYFLHEVTINPTGGEDVITCLNKDGKPFDDEQLRAAVKELWLKNRASASEDEGVLIQPLDRAAASGDEVDWMALSYHEIAEKFDLS